MIRRKMFLNTLRNNEFTQKRVKNKIKATLAERKLKAFPKIEKLIIVQALI